MLRQAARLTFLQPSLLAALVALATPLPSQAQDLKPNFRPSLCKTPPCLRSCSEDERKEILKPASHSLDFVSINCSILLQATDTITRRLAFGPVASSADFNCNGATIRNTAKGSQKNDYYRVLIRSQFDHRNRTWKQVRDVSLRNCLIHGAIQVGSNLTAEHVRSSSFSSGHSERMQSIAATNIHLQNLSLRADKSSSGHVQRTLLYVGIGVTELTLEGAKLSGATESIAVYLDAETSRNTIRDNLFEVTTLRREIIAVDGSADNHITDNKFVNPRNGAIFIYRNCGETGLVRHQEPRRNIIARNTFRFPLRAARPKPVIWVASREKGANYRSWCDLDKGHSYGSGISDLDFAKDNRIIDNVFINLDPEMAVVIDDPENEESGTIIQSWP